MTRNKETTPQNQLLSTQTVRLEKEGIDIRFAELGDASKPLMLAASGYSRRDIQRHLSVAIRVLQ